MQHQPDCQQAIREMGKGEPCHRIGGRNCTDPPQAGQSEPAKQIGQLEEELREAMERQVATEEILRVISSSPTSAQPVFETIVQAGQKLFPGATVSIALQDGDKVQVVAIAGPDPADVEAWRKRFPVPLHRETLHGYVILEGETVGRARCCTGAGTVPDRGPEIFSLLGTGRPP